MPERLGRAFSAVAIAQPGNHSLVPGRRVGRSGEGRRSVSTCRLGGGEAAARSLALCRLCRLVSACVGGRHTRNLCPTGVSSICVTLSIYFRLIGRELYWREG